jgi:hypothetical protein
MAQGEECGLDHLCFQPLPYWTRQQIRKKKHMRADGFADTFVLFFCTFCEIVQEGRELKNGNFDKPKTEYYLATEPKVQQSLIVKETNVVVISQNPYH